MPSPRHHVVDIKDSKNTAEASTQPSARSTLAEDLRDQPIIARGGVDTHGQESVVEGNVQPTWDGGRSKSAPIILIGSSDDNPKSNADARKPVDCSTLAEDIRDRPTIAGRKQDRHVQESVTEKYEETTPDEGQARSDPIFFIAPPDENPKSDAGIRKDSMIDESSGDFLQNCWQCKTNLPETATLYMHSGDNIYAFCSIGCRRKWMEHMEVATTSGGGDHIQDKQR